MLEVNKENAVPPLTELMGWRKTHTSNQCPPCLMCSCDKRWEDKVHVLWAYKTGLQAGDESLWKWHLHKDPTATTRLRVGYGAEWSGKPWGPEERPAQRPRGSRKPGRRLCGWNAESPGIVQNEAQGVAGQDDADLGTTVRSTQVF